MALVQITNPETVLPIEELGSDPKCQHGLPAPSFKICQRLALAFLLQHLSFNGDAVFLKSELTL